LLLIRGILAALRQEIHLTTCPNSPGYFCCVRPADRCNNAAQVQTLVARVAELEAKLGGPPKTPDNSSLPPSQGKKPNRAEKVARRGPRPGSLGRMGGGRPLAETPDETVIAKPVRCAQCQAALAEADHVLQGRYDKIDLPQVAPLVTRVERYAGHCRCCGGTTLAPVPEGLEPGTPFSVGIVALAMSGEPLVRRICVSCTRSATSG